MSIQYKQLEQCPICGEPLTNVFITEVGDTVYKEENEEGQIEEFDYYITDVANFILKDTDNLLVAEMVIDHQH